MTIQAIIDIEGGIGIDDPGKKKATMASTEICWPSTTTRCLWFPCRGKKIPRPRQKKNTTSSNQSELSIDVFDFFFLGGGGGNTRKTNPKCIVPTCFFTQTASLSWTSCVQKWPTKLHPSFLELPIIGRPKQMFHEKSWDQNGPPPPGGCLHVTKQRAWTRQCHTMNPQAVPVIDNWKFSLVSYNPYLVP